MKFKYWHILICLSFLYFIKIPYSQNQNQHPFFPHHVGDIWEYIEIDMDTGSIVDILQAIIRSNSTDSLYRTHVWFQLNRLGSRFNKPASYPGGIFIIDSSYNVYHLEQGHNDKGKVTHFDKAKGTHLVNYRCYRRSP